MSPLRQALVDYLRIRRALGYKLERAGKLLPQFLDYLEQIGAETVTTERALAWATLPAAGSRRWWAFRLSIARGFACYLQTLDPTTEVVPRPRICSRAGRGGRRRTCTRTRRSRRCSQPPAVCGLRCGSRPIGR